MLILKCIVKLGEVGHAYNPSTGEPKAGGLTVGGQPGLLS